MKGGIHALSKRATALLKAGNLQQAQKVFSQICAMDPNRPDMWSALAKTNSDLGDFVAAESAFRQVIMLSPNMATAYCNLGVVLQRRGKQDEAITCFQHAIQLDPQQVGSHYTLGNALQMRGDLAAATEAYRNAYRINSEYSGVWYVLVSVLMLQDRLEEATSIFREVLSIKPETAQQLDVFVPEACSATVHSATCDVARENRGLTIATSLAPRKFETQQQAIASWKRLGFHVVSLNSSEEIDAIRSHFKGVEFVTISRDARETHRRPYVYFDDILAYFKGSNDHICGIVNSDIILKSEQLVKFIMQEAPGSLLYGCRVDIASPNRLEGETYKYGFDYFFFDSQYLDIYPAERFCIGLPWWDFWAVLVPMLKRIPVKKLTTQVAYHVKHDTNWSPESWITLAESVGNYIGASQAPTAQTTRYYVNYVWLLIEQYCTEVTIE
ncbi:tetratricopeptide repeat protein [Pseudomonadota bacterium]